MQYINQKVLIPNKQVRINKIGRFGREKLFPVEIQDPLITNKSNRDLQTNEWKYIEDLVQKNRVNPLNIFTPQSSKSKCRKLNLNKNLFDQIYNKFTMTDGHKFSPVFNFDSNSLLKNKNNNKTSKDQLQNQESSETSTVSKFTIYSNYISSPEGNESQEKNTIILNAKNLKNIGRVFNTTQKLKFPNIEPYLNNKRFLKFKFHHLLTHAKKSQNDNELHISKTLLLEAKRSEKNLNDYHTYKNDRKSRAHINDLKTMNNIKISQSTSNISLFPSKTLSLTSNFKRKCKIIDNRFINLMAKLKEKRNVKAISNIIEMNERLIYQKKKFHY